eukprot:CAMPEP_0196573044 /NCGR_PEP_ID=MMETSP1081-20130531/3014_1 /TAXON_ID=36882 /ORGANISM="Pyramimonas amylifera, Strain CCMP720" /LENGTH=70 /DNA_ID=CAMNT_0041890607 /DNA_START=493 /DNA_END=705 /DNA_ORIENTATION=-
MWATNPDLDSEKNKRYLENQSLDSQVRARLNKEKLGGLLADIGNKEASEERYRQALLGFAVGPKNVDDHK